MIGGRAPSKYLPILRKSFEDNDKEMSARTLEAQEKLECILKAHWIVPDKLEEDQFGHCFEERGQAMLDLIARTMGKPTVDRRQVFRDELKSASLGVGQVDDDEVEHNPMGEALTAV